MSKIYNFIESQVNTILRLALTNDEGQIDFSGSRFISVGNVQLVISILAALVYLLILAMAGIYLWNQGIHAMAPSVLLSFGGRSFPQLQNQYQQLFITLLAMVMFF
jgi:hypothetical protein